MAIQKTQYNPQDAHYGHENLGEQESTWKSSDYDETGHGKAQYGGGGPNNLTVSNTTDKPMEVAITGNEQEPEYYTIPSGASLDFALPENFSGRVQKKTGNAGDPANLAEFTFENKEGQEPKLWMNQSDVKGRNSSILMEGGGQSLGSTNSIANQVPSDLMSHDQYGNPYLEAPDQNSGVKDFLTNHLNGGQGADSTYVMYNDDTAMRDSGMNGGDAHNLNVSFGDF